MFTNKISPQSLLSTLWVFILFNMILRDLHEFPTDGYIEEMMALKLSDGIMLVFAFVAEIPILMILLSRILNHRVNKWANTFAVIITSMGISYTLLTADYDDIFFALMNFIAMFIILRTVWKLPANNSYRIDAINLKS